MLGLIAIVNSVPLVLICIMDLITGEVATVFEGVLEGLRLVE